MNHRKKNLTDFIRYEHKKYHELTEETEINIIKVTAEKLAPVAHDIIEHQDGKIIVKSSGNVYIIHFPHALGYTISDLLGD